MAEILTGAGDTIDASNVSRYLARYPDLPSIKIGKFRYVDPVKLARHRKTNVNVLEKQDARGVEPAKASPIAPSPETGPVEDLPETEATSEIQQANLALRKLQIREKELALAEKEGTLVPDVEVLALISGVMQAMITALEGEEIAMVQKFGREVGAGFRKARRAAQARAASRLSELARQHLPPALSAQAPAAVPVDAAA